MRITDELIDFNRAAWRQIPEFVEQRTRQEFQSLLDRVEASPVI